MEDSVPCLAGSSNDLGIGLPQNFIQLPVGFGQPVVRPNSSGLVRLKAQARVWAALNDKQVALVITSTLLSACFQHVPTEVLRTFSSTSSLSHHGRATCCVCRKAISNACSADTSAVICTVATGRTGAQCRCGGRDIQENEDCDIP